MAPPEPLVELPHSKLAHGVGLGEPFELVWVSGCPAAHCLTPFPSVKGASGVPAGWPAATLDCRGPGVRISQLRAHPSQWAALGGDRNSPHSRRHGADIQAASSGGCLRQGEPDKVAEPVANVTTTSRGRYRRGPGQGPQWVTSGHVRRPRSSIGAAAPRFPPVAARSWPSSPQGVSKVLTVSTLFTLSSGGWLPRSVVSALKTAPPAALMEPTSISRPHGAIVSAQRRERSFKCGGFPGCPAAHCLTPFPSVKGASGVPAGWPAATLDCRGPGVRISQLRVHPSQWAALGGDRNSPLSRRHGADIHAASSGGCLRQREPDKVAEPVANVTTTSRGRYRRGPGQGPQWVTSGSLG